jgi:hypothetical protein
MYGIYIGWDFKINIMKKIIYTSVLLILTIYLKAQNCHVAVLDTASVTFMQPENITDSGYMQSVTFTIHEQGLVWKNAFSLSDHIFLFIPNTYTVSQVQQYCIQQIFIYIRNNYPDN